MKQLTEGEIFQGYIAEYRKQLEKGAIKVAYKGLMEYIMGLKVHFQKKYPEYFASSGIYYGYMDMTYFPLFPEPLKRRKMKIAVVFNHCNFRFEVWLAGYNKQIQTKYWKLIKEGNLSEYHVPSTTKGSDSIVEYVLVENPDFSDLDALTCQIEAGVLKFINDVEGFLSKYEG